MSSKSSMSRTSAATPPPVGLAPEPAAASFAERQAAHGPALHAHLRRLYGTHPDHAASVARLDELLAASHAARSAELQALDAQRLQDPDWFLSPRMLAYSAYVDRYGGTLAGVAQRIAHLRELGVTYLHLLPFLRARPGQNDGGFAVESYDEIEPALGTLDDLGSLTRALRAEGISLCSDFVLNHVADTHDWARAARRGDPRYRAYFHVLDSEADVAAYEAGLPQIFPLTAPGNFTYSRELAGWVWTTFYPYQWDLNYANPAVFVDIAAALLRLANRGVEVFRLDSAAFLWKRPGTPCMNQPEAHWILQALRCVVDIAAPGTLLKAEAIVPSRELPPYLGLPDAPGRECHLAYQSSVMTAAWVALAEGSAELLQRVLAETPAVPPHTGWLTYVRCHDDIGWNVLRNALPPQQVPRLAAASRFYAGLAEGSFARGASFQASDANAVHGTNGMAASLLGYDTAHSDAERDAALARLLLLYGVALSVGGIAMVYMGDEFALGNDPTPPALWPPGADGRQLHRPALPESVLAQAADEQSRAGAAWAGLRRLIAARRSVADFAGNVPLRLRASGDARVLAFQRGDVLCLFNFAASDCTLTLPAAGMTDVVSGRRIVGRSLPLPGYGLRWLRGAEHAA